MLIGFDLVRCLSDILEKKVEYSDVLLVITCVEIDFRDEDQWNIFWKSTIDPIHLMLGNNRHKLHLHDKSEVHNLIDDLLYDGKLVKRERTHVLDSISSLPGHWHDIIPLEEHMTPAVQDAWNYFKMIEALCRAGKNPT
jgi:hypothetical protein|tara:strand:+ start:11043 stop:11459 length:417 start_codon:yes stop_codon:yes gene_type:complete